MKEVPILNTIPLNKQQIRPFERDDLVRLGNPGSDGGYATPEACVLTSPILLSLGISDDWTFDADYLERNPNAIVIGVDHTIGGTMFVLKVIKHVLKSGLYLLLFNRFKSNKHRRLARFYGSYFTVFAAPSEHLKLMVADQDTTKSISFTSLMERAREPLSVAQLPPHAVFVKCDIEGSEYDIIDQIVELNAGISGLVLEFHNLATAPEIFNSAIENLNTVFTLVHIHGNNFGEYSVENDFPDCVEVTFVHKELMRADAVHSTATYPVDGLDVPCSPRGPDYKLKF